MAWSGRLDAHSVAVLAAPAAESTARCAAPLRRPVTSSTVRCALCAKLSVRCVKLSARPGFVEVRALVVSMVRSFRESQSWENGTRSVPCVLPATFAVARDCDNRRGLNTA